MELKPTNEEGIRVGYRKDGQKYSVRESRKRYFFPHEWRLFEKQFKNKKHRFFFLTLLNTGARAMEALHLRSEDFDLERGTITFKVVKHRAAKKHNYSLGKKRVFFVGSNYLKEAKKFLKNKEQNKYLFLEDKNLPPHYNDLNNKEKKKYFLSKMVGYNQMLKRKLKKSGIKDYKQFSLHNIRKTYGNWMRIFEIRTEEICYRLGHDLETYYNNYGSSLIFSPEEKREIMNIYGDVK